MTPTASAPPSGTTRSHEQLEHQDAYSIDHRIEEVLAGLGFAESEFHRAASTFSGGQQSRMMLAKLLLESPDLMLLDEPSNHLDIDTTEWLENYLARQPVAMVVVSHDRYFLDKVVTRIWELHDGRITAYPGNYTQYWRLRGEKAKVLDRQAERQEEKAASSRPISASTVRASGPSRPRTARGSSSGSRRAGRDDARYRRPVHGLRRGRPLRRHRHRGPQPVQGVTTSRSSPT